MDTTKGLLPKYKLSHADGRRLDPKARYFILRYDEDPAALSTLHTYIAIVADHAPYLARDLLREIHAQLASDGEAAKVIASWPPEAQKMLAEVREQYAALLELK